MNTISHFLAAYLIGRKIGLTREKLFLVTLFGIISDFDVPFFYLIMGFKNPSIYHAGITHTFLFGMISAVIASLIMLFHDSRKNDTPLTLKSFLMLVSCAMLGLTIHLGMDVITTANMYASFHHLYFWPLWNFSFHIEYMLVVPHSVIWGMQLIMNFLIIGFLLHDYFKEEKRPWGVLFWMDAGRKHKRLDNLLIALFFYFFIFWQASLILRIFGMPTFDLVNFILDLVT